MSIARILLFTLLLSSIIVAVALFNLESDSGDAETPETAAESTTPKTTPPSTATTAPMAPSPTMEEDLSSPEEMDDEQLEKDQVAQAMGLLNSTNDEERIEAVEQLGAYPSAETEAALAQVLNTDANPEVRNAAALSLGAMDQPTDATIAALMTALEDQNEDVRFSALSTLEDFMLGQEENSQRYRQIKDGLAMKANSSNLPEDLKESINEVLKDQETITAPEAEPDN
ncbi:MAG: HEAT repeat domain-containing protein [Methylococcus sp.]